jgi:tetratricopeptide (TPR) repeat protein
LTVSTYDRAPYPGLRSFKRAETDLFFGRDDCVEAMVGRLRATRFLAVLGSSGCGKSSLVHTGLLSGLEMGLLGRASSRWRIVDFRPGGEPLRNLARRLLETNRPEAQQGAAGLDEIDVEFLRARLKRAPDSLIEWCRESDLPDGTNLLFLVDQFEELFRYQSYASREEAEAFVARLLEIKRLDGTSGNNPSLYVAITMRSEYLGASALIDGLAEAINEGAYLIPRMTRDECREAIIGPANVCGIEIEPALVNRMLNDLTSFAPWDGSDASDQLSRLARRADQLPVMQHALNQLWREAKEANNGGGSGQGITLTLAEYTAIGGVAGALDRHANNILKQLGAERSLVAETVFRALTSGTAVADAVRRPISFGELVNVCNGDEAAVRTVVDAFRAPGCNFLLPEIDREPVLNDGTTIDITHESLIRQWKTLSAWLEKEGRAAHEWRRLKDDAERNELLSGRRLLNAITFRDEIKPNVAWAERYGGGFDRVQRLIAKSRTLKIIKWLGAVTAVFALIIGYTLYQQEAARQDFERSVMSAQKLLDTLSASIAQGDVSVKNASDTLAAAVAVVPELPTVKQTTKTVAPLVKLLWTASDIEAELGRYFEAYASARKARDLVEPLRGANPDDPEMLKLLFGSLWRMGDATSYRGMDRAFQEQALAEYLEARTIARRLWDMSPKDGARARELMFIHLKIGNLQQALRDPDAALVEYRTALTLIENVVARAPKEAPELRSWRRDLAHTLRRIGGTLIDKQDFVGAIEQYRAALKILTDLAQDDPSDDAVQADLASIHRDIARAQERRNDLTAALIEYQRAIDVQSRLVHKDISNATWQLSLASFRAGMGSALRRRGDLAGALEEYRAAYAIRQSLARKDLTNQARQTSYAMAGIAVADLLTEQKENLADPAKQKQNLDEAVRLYREAIEILDEVRPRYDRNVFDSYIRIGDIFNSRVDQDGALKEYKIASGIALSLAAQNPDSVIWQRNLATSYIKLGDVLTAQQDSRGALEHYEKALEIVTALAEKDSTSPNGRHS